MDLQIKTPRWAVPLLQPARYKGAYGGRAGGKSHFFAEYLVERMVEDPDLRVVCLREIQKSLKFSSKTLIEDKIRALGVSHLFEVIATEIRRVGGQGVCLFQGLQDRTADSLKSLEGFGIAWVEEAQCLSRRSLNLLRPTIRAPGSEILFSWNPDQPEDAVDEFFRGPNGLPEDSTLVKVSILDNPWRSQTSMREMLLDRSRDTDTYLHVWEGHYNVKSKLQIFAGKWRVDEFEPDPELWDGPYFGEDWGFGVSPTVAVKVWVWDSRLWVERESWEVGLELDDTGDRWIRDIPGIEQHVVRSDSARPESISHVRSDGGGRRKAIPFLQSVTKWPGSIEHGIEFIRSFREVVIHERCPHTKENFRLYRYKSNRAGDPLPIPLDANNDVIDAIRYALAPLIQQKQGELVYESAEGDLSLNRYLPGNFGDNGAIAQY